MLKFSRKNRLEQVAEIDVTTFMNLMVILVPFLLVTAVFSRMTVLQLQLPSKMPKVALPPRWIFNCN